MEWFMKCPMIYLLVFLIFPGVFFYKSHLRKISEIAEIMNKSDTYILRGFAAISIMFAHYIVYGMEEADTLGGLISVYQWAGGLGVCIFFFCSGYGLLLSINGKEVNKTFLWKRVKSIFPVYCGLRLVFAILLKETQNGLFYFILYVLGIKVQFWFITEILLVYILFYISAKISKKHIILIMSAMLTIMSMVFYFFDFEPRWYNANLVFVLGMALAQYKKMMIDFLNRNYLLKMAGIISLFGILAIIFLMLRGKSDLSNFMKLFAGALTCIMLFELLIKVKLESPFMIFAGKNSLQLYIIHIFIWQVYSQQSKNFPACGGDIQLKFLSCVAISILFAYACEKAGLIIKMIVKRTGL